MAKMKTGTKLLIGGVIALGSIFVVKKVAHAQARKQLPLGWEDFKAKNLGTWDQTGLPLGELLELAFLGTDIEEGDISSSRVPWGAASDDLMLTSQVLLPGVYSAGRSPEYYHELYVTSSTGQVSTLPVYILELPGGQFVMMYDTAFALSGGY